MSASRNRSGRRLLGLSWAHLLNDGAANYLPGVLPAVLVALHLPVSTAGALIAALTMGQALQPVTGWLADRLGGRSLVVGGLLLSSLGGALLGFAGSTWLLVLLLLLIGVGNACFHPQALAGVRTIVEGRQGLVTSAFLVGGELGRGLWPTVASLVVSGPGLRWLWLVGLPGLLTVPVLWRVAPNLEPRPRTGQRIRWARHTRPMVVLVGYQCVRAFTIYVLVTFIPILWHLGGGSLVQGASIISTMVTVGVVGNLWGGHLTDRFGRLPMLVTSGVASAVLIVPVILLGGVWVWVFAAVLGVALFLTASTTILIGQDTFPENRSMGSGIALGLANGVGAFLVLLVGLWVGNDNITVVFWAVAALTLASALLALALPVSLRGHTHPSGRAAATQADDSAAD
ncbi:MAG TPA: MFS transporter [Segeticoccus sp.]|uniref:MFS transporter n=1 Tax=Segeticoccus sp. TaxID=2706531 RepID=UPI002D80F78D|nr:MFS transporter [Segeticoccus sp.]HET8600785.1 MFS transporter [Segeticoccus sp.]